MIALAIAFGLVIGLSLGALGGGGSILTVPVLVYVLGESPHTATGASLIVVGIAAAFGLVSHARAGHVAWAQGVVFGLLGGIGSVGGTRLSKSVDQHVLLAAFAGLMLLAATVMLLRQRRHKPDAAEQHTTTGDSCSQWSRCWLLKALRVLAAASVVGLLTGFFGVGGGFIAVPALTIALGFGMPEAVGTSLLVIAINAAIALGARAGTSLDYGVVVPFAAAAIAGTLAGSAVTRRLPAARLSQAFAVLLLGVAGYVASQSVPHLFS